MSLLWGLQKEEHKNRDRWSVTVWHISFSTEHKLKWGNRIQDSTVLEQVLWLMSWMQWCILYSGTFLLKHIAIKLHSLEIWRYFFFIHQSLKIYWLFMMIFKEFRRNWSCPILVQCGRILLEDSFLNTSYNSAQILKTYTIRAEYIGIRNTSSFAPNFRFIDICYTTLFQIRTKCIHTVPSRDLVYCNWGKSGVIIGIWKEIENCGLNTEHKL